MSGDGPIHYKTKVTAVVTWAPCVLTHDPSKFLMNTYCDDGGVIVTRITSPGDG